MQVSGLQKGRKVQVQVKRGPGRPRRGEGTEHIDLTLSKEVIAFLRAMPSGERSQFVDQWMKQHPEYKRIDSGKETTCEPHL